MYDEGEHEDDDVAPASCEPIKHRWHTDELANEVREFGVDGRGQVVLACRCILESEGNENAFREPFISAVAGVCGNEFAGRELELIEAFDRINLVGILETMRALEYFRLSDVQSVVGQIVRNKVRRILFLPSPRAPNGKEGAPRTSRRLRRRTGRSSSRESSSAASSRRCATPLRAIRNSGGPFASSSISTTTSTPPG